MIFVNIDNNRTISWQYLDDLPGDNFPKKSRYLSKSIITLQYHGKICMILKSHGHQCSAFARAT